MSQLTVYQRMRVYAQLKAHPAHKRIYFNVQHRAFFVDQVKFSGLTTSLSKCFYKDYNFSEAWQKRVRTPVKRLAGAHRTKASLRGSIIHKQVQKFCDVKGSYDTFKTTVRAIHPLTKTTIAYLLKEGIMSVDGHMKIFDPLLKIATEIDHVGIRAATGKLVIMELKTGFEGFMNVPTGQGKMHGILSNISNEAYWQWQLQLLMMTLMLVRCYGIDIDDIEPIILRVHDSGITTIYLHKDIKDLAPQIYDSLMLRHSNNQVQKAVVTSTTTKKKNNKRKEMDITINSNKEEESTKKIVSIKRRRIHPVVKSVKKATPLKKQAKKKSKPKNKK